MSIASNMGLKRDSSRGSFVESVLNAAEAFYGDVLQKLRTWKPAPPKLKKHAEKEVSPETLLAVLRELGAPLHSITDAPAALRERRQERWRQLAEPVIVTWDSRPAVECVLRMASSAAIQPPSDTPTRWTASRSS